MNLRMQVYKTGTQIVETFEIKGNIFGNLLHTLPNLEKTTFLNFTFPRKWNEVMSRVRRVKYFPIG
jgi:hypothetical protein